MRLPGHVELRQLDIDTVLFDRRTGRTHALAKTEGRLLALLHETGSPTQAASRCAAELGRDPDDVRRELDALCRGLLALGLLEQTG